MLWYRPLESLEAQVPGFGNSGNKGWHTAVVGGPNTVCTSPQMESVFGSVEIVAVHVSERVVHHIYLCPWKLEACTSMAISDAENVFLGAPGVRAGGGEGSSVHKVIYAYR